MEKTKTVIIGAGPAGIAIAAEIKEAGLAPAVLLEKAAHACDTIVKFYRAGKRVDAVYQKVEVEPLGLLSFTTESKEAFLARMEEVIGRYGLDIRYGQECQKILAKDDSFLIYSAGGLQFEAKIVVVAIGIFGKPVKPSYPIPKELHDRVFYALPKKTPAGKEILVVGGGDSAAEAACFLCRDNQVLLSYRQASFFRVNEVNMCTLDGYCCEGKVKTKVSSDIEAVEPDGERIRVQFKNDSPMSFDLLFYFLGGSSPRVFLENAGVHYSGNRPQLDEAGETNIPRFFLVGDLALDKGSIMGAFNSAWRAKNGMVSRYRELALA